MENFEERVSLVSRLIDIMEVCCWSVVRFIMIEPLYSNPLKWANPSNQDTLICPKVSGTKRFRCPKVWRFHCIIDYKTIKF